MSRRILICCFLALFACGCGTSGQSADSIANANSGATATTVTRPGPDNSEITTTTDANGVTSETRVFHDNPRVAKVVVTTNGGHRTVRAYSPGGEEREVKQDEPAKPLEATGDAIADAAGFVADKTVTGAKKGAEVSKTVGDKTAEGAKTVGDKTVEGAKTVGGKTAEGAKKTGKAIKRAVTP